MLIFKFQIQLGNSFFYLIIYNQLVKIYNITYLQHYKHTNTQTIITLY